MTEDEKMHEIGLEFQRRCRERIANGGQDPDHQPAMEALVRLAEVAQGHSGQCHHVRRFLLGIYNPEAWPFELNRLKCLDGRLAHDCMKVLNYNTFKARQEMHTYLKGGDSLFKSFWEREREEDDD